MCGLMRVAVFNKTTIADKNLSTWLRDVQGWGIVLKLNLKFPSSLSGTGRYCFLELKIQISLDLNTFEQHKLGLCKHTTQQKMQQSSSCFFILLSINPTNHSLHMYVVISFCYGNNSICRCSYQQLLKFPYIFFYCIAAETSIRIAEENTYFEEERHPLRQPLSKISINHPTWLRLLAPMCSQKKWNGQWEWLAKQREIRERFAYIFTETCLHHNITYQAVVLDGPTEFRANRAQDMERWTCVYTVNAWCCHVFLTIFFSIVHETHKKKITSIEP